MDEKTETILLYHWLGVLNEGSHWRALSNLNIQTVTVLTPMVLRLCRCACECVLVRTLCEFFRRFDDLSATILLVHKQSDVLCVFVVQKKKMIFANIGAQRGPEPVS